MKLPVITMDRLRIETDGDGVTTLIISKGCPLRCKYCLNPYSFDEKTPAKLFSPEELYGKLKIDSLYFMATGGGVTFGGGEPLLHADFIAEFRKICGADWHINIETSLNVPEENVKTALAAANFFIVDIKDMDADIYRAYTGRDNALVKRNLRLIAQAGRASDVRVRLPLIPGYNDADTRAHSKNELVEMGFTCFDEFRYSLRRQNARP